MSMSAHPALVLNADFRPMSYFPLSLLSWQDAVHAVFSERVSVVAEYDAWARSPYADPAAVGGGVAQVPAHAAPARPRDRLWPIFETVRRQIAQRGLLTEAGVFRAVAEHYRERSPKPFDNIVVDEAQDLGVPELRFLAAIASAAPDALCLPRSPGRQNADQPP